MCESEKHVKKKQLRRLKEITQFRIHKNFLRSNYLKTNYFNGKIQFNVLLTSTGGFKSPCTTICASNFNLIEDNLDNILISDRIQSGQSESPQKRNFCLQTIYIIT